MSDQPEALRLADALDNAPYSCGCTNEAAAELRRLHAEASDFHMAYRMKCDEETKAQAEQIERLREERSHYRARLERAGMLIHKIYALLYPPHVTLADGRTMAFRPSSFDPHEVLQELSDRIRALPDELDAALKEAK